MVCGLVVAGGGSYYAGEVGEFIGEFIGKVIYEVGQ